MKSLEDIHLSVDRSGLFLNRKLEENSTDSLSLGFLVVMTMTPLPERTPQIDAAVASFSTVTICMSLGLILSRSPSYGKLSTTMSGLVLENMVLLPLTLSPSGFPVFRSISKPLVTPFNLESRLMPGLRWMVLESTNEKLPVALSFGMDW